VYSLTGSRVVRCPRSAPVQQVQGAFKGFLLDPQRIRFMAYVLEQPPTVLAAGKFVADGKRLDPNVAANRESSSSCPSTATSCFASARSCMQCRPRFRSRTECRRRSPPFPATTSCTGTGASTTTAGFILTGRERWLVMRYDLVDSGNKANRRRSAKAALVSQALHVVARFPAPTWREGLPSRRATQRMFDQPRTINTLELGDASEPFADSELPLESPVDSCKRSQRSAMRPA
jgi:hypothetical protein